MRISKKNHGIQMAKFWADCDPAFNNLGSDNNTADPIFTGVSGNSGLCTWDQSNIIYSIGDNRNG